MSFLKNKNLWFGFLLFLILNVLLYFFIQIFNGRVKFDYFDYKVNAHHFLVDSRINGGKFNMLRALGQYDAQWYLKISKSGYPSHPHDSNINNKKIMGSLTYAFFPLYPLVVGVFNYGIKNVEVSAFTLANILMILNFFSLYFVISKFYKSSVALKTIFLIFLFPFSIFFRSYFTEGLFLLELVWFSYFLIKKNWIASSLTLGLLIVSRGTGFFLVPVFIFFLFEQKKKNLLIIWRRYFYIFVALIPFSLWIIYNYSQTGNPFFFVYVQRAWTVFPIPILEYVYNFLFFPSLPLHEFHSSQTNMVLLLVVLFILIKAKKNMIPELWFISFALWIGPIMTTSSMSFARFQIISFPIFLYLAQTLKGYKYFILILFFVGVLLITSLLFVNWYWLG